MKYLLFLDHPKGEKVYKVPKNKEKSARKYFKTIDRLETVINFENTSIPVTVDYEIFSKESNFDCFNCQDPCCGDNPVIFSKNVRNFLIDNLQDFNSLSLIPDLLREQGYDNEEILDIIKNEDLLIPEEIVENEVNMCVCSYKPDNSRTLCAIHALALKKGFKESEIAKLKPTVCSLWPLEILVEDDLSHGYITLPDHFTNSFITENFYEIPCINQEYSESATFRRKNPVGFPGENFKPFYLAYENTLKLCLGDVFFQALTHKIVGEKYE